MAKMNALKQAALARMIWEGISADVAKKALGRLERWMKAAYGEVDYDAYSNESGDVVGGARAYVNEILAGSNKVTYNSQAFGIQGTGHSSRGRRRS